MGTRRFSPRGVASVVSTSVLLDTISNGLFNICGHTITTALESMSATLKPDVLNATADLPAKTNLEIGLVTLTLTGVMINIFIAVILYQAHLGFERFLPTRGASTYSQSDQQTIGKVTDYDPAREDEIVKRLIAQGKIKRASVNWTNIVLKWAMINLLSSYLSVWTHSVVTALQYGIRLTSLFNIHSLVAPIIQSIFASFSPASIACFISMVAVPARYRLVSVSAATLLAATMLSVFVSLNIHWIVSTGFVRQVMLEAINQRDNDGQDGPGR